MSDVESVTAPKFHQVFIGNIPQDMSEDAITSLVREKAGGSFASVRLAKEKTGQFRGFGYIDYVEKEQAEAAIAALTGVDMEGRVLKVDLAVPREVRPKPERPPQENSCFVGNLDFSVSDEQVLDLCNSVLGEGKVVKVRLAVDRETGAQTVHDLPCDHALLTLFD
jgi:RNA recognition motif-containing protein